MCYNIKTKGETYPFFTFHIRYTDIINKAKDKHIKFEFTGYEGCENCTEINDLYALFPIDFYFESYDSITGEFSDDEKLSQLQGCDVVTFYGEEIYLKLKIIIKIYKK